jgi:acyl carrier protein
MIRAALVEIIVELGIEPERIADDAHLQDDLELDSTETVQIGLELKRRFGVDVKLESSQDLTVLQVLAMVDAALQESSPAGAGGAG